LTVSDLERRLEEARRQHGKHVEFEDDDEGSFEIPPEVAYAIDDFIRLRLPYNEYFLLEAKDIRQSKLVLGSRPGDRSVEFNGWTVIFDEPESAGFRPKPVVALTPDGALRQNVRGYWQPLSPKFNKLLSSRSRPFGASNDDRPVTNLNFWRRVQGALTNTQQSR
jgi:hypothetical protein